MAESQTKRPREQEHEEQDVFSSDMELTKRHKDSYNEILSILDDNTEDEQQETTQDLTDFFTSLQQELSSSDPLPELTIEPKLTVKDEPEDANGDKYYKEKVIRHLLEASDDELGIPNRVADGGGDEVSAGKDGEVPVTLWDSLWELEDDTANYYTLMHSELIM